MVQRREEASNPIDVKLKQVADELHSVAVGYLQVCNTCICFSSRNVCRLNYCSEFQRMCLYFGIMTFEIFNLIEFG